MMHDLSALRWIESFFVWVLLFGPAAVVVIALYVAVPWQARRRGYSFWLWLIAGLVALSQPVTFLVLLALMPNRARKRLREKFRAELEAKLAARPASAVTTPAMATPVPAGSTAITGRSLGDLPTVAPREHSIGDEETRGPDQSARGNVS
jgi:hypothetical protein